MTSTRDILASVQPATLSAPTLVHVAYAYVMDEANTGNTDPTDIEQAFYDGMVAVLRAITSADSPDANDTLARLLTR